VRNNAENHWPRRARLHRRVAFLMIAHSAVWEKDGHGDPSAIHGLEGCCSDRSGQRSLNRPPKNCRDRKNATSLMEGSRPAPALKCFLQRPILFH